MKHNNKFIYPKTVRETIEGKRHYNINDKEKLPSVTTILSKTSPKEKEEGLRKWREKMGEENATRIVDEAAARGTAMHKILERYIGEEGYLDLTAVGQNAHVDFKQTNKPKKREWIDDYCLQLAAYGMAHDYVHKTKINKAVIMMCSKDNYYQEFIIEGEEYKKYKHKWLARVNQYYEKTKK